MKNLYALYTTNKTFYLTEAEVLLPSVPVQGSCVLEGKTNSSC